MFPVSRLLSALVLVAPLFSNGLTAQASDLPCVPGRVNSFHTRFNSLRTGYYPDSSQMEGGFKDREGRPLQNLQDYLKGKVSYVSVAMDSHVLPYGTKLRIPAVEQEFGRCIEFRVVDTGGRFEGKGTRKIDICNDNEQHSYQPYTNGMAEVFVVQKP